MGCDLVNTYSVTKGAYISIHAPIVGCDLIAKVHPLLLGQFQSTHPSWGATKEVCGMINTKFISIHAPIVGCDAVEI